MAEARLIDATPSGTVVFELDVGEQYSNLRGKEQENILSSRSNSSAPIRTNANG